MSDRCADRVYAALLDPTLAPADAGPRLEFLAKCLVSARPAPATVRPLTRAALDYAVGRGEAVRFGLLPLRSLLVYGASYRQPIADEISKRVAVIIASDDASIRIDGLRLIASVPSILDVFIAGPDRPMRDEENSSFWRDWSQDQSRLYAAEFVSGATKDEELRILALCQDAIGPQVAVAMPGGLSVLATVTAVIIEEPDGRGGLSGLLICFP